MTNTATSASTHARKRKRRHDAAPMQDRTRAAARRRVPDGGKRVTAKRREHDDRRRKGKDGEDGDSRKEAGGLLNRRRHAVLQTPKINPLQHVDRGVRDARQHRERGQKHATARAHERIARQIQGEGGYHGPGREGVEPQSGGDERGVPGDDGLHIIGEGYRRDEKRARDLDQHEDDAPKGHVRLLRKRRQPIHPRDAEEHNTRNDLVRKRASSHAREHVEGVRGIPQMRRGRDEPDQRDDEGHAREPVDGGALLLPKTPPSTRRPP